MSDVVIKYHDFEEAKKELKKFSEQTVTDLDLKRVRETKSGGKFLTDIIFHRGVGLDHQVTGEELNELTTQIQSHLYYVNNTQIKLIKEFGQVYTALEALDKDYIQAILISIKATEETSKRIEATQGQIGKIVEDQRKTLEVLKRFKQKLDTYAHLGDIDKIWNDCQKWHTEISELSGSVSSAVSVSNSNTKKIEETKTVIKNTNSRIEEVRCALKNTDSRIEKVSGVLKNTDSRIEEIIKVINNTEKAIIEIEKSLKEQIAQMETLISFTNKLEEIIHLQDVDKMWDSLVDAHNSLQSMFEELKSVKETANIQQKEIDKLLEFVSFVSKYEHLKDIDKIWDLSERNFKYIEELQQQEREQEKKIVSLVQKSNQTLEMVQKNQTEIAGLKEYRQQLSDIEHLKNVDQIWDLGERNFKHIQELQKQEEETKTVVYKNKEMVDAAIAEILEKNEISVEILSKKIKYANLIAGSSLGIALIELIIILMKVI